MPKNLIVDWDHALQLYTQGMKYVQIAKIIGIKAATLGQHAKRHHWVQRRTKAQQAIETVVSNIVMRQPETLQKRAEKWIERTADDVERTVEQLSKLKVPQDLAGLAVHEQVWGMHTKRGRSTFGLDQAGASVQINVGVINRGELMPVEVIDVQAEPENNPPTV